MHLQKIEIHGFKSFARKKALEFCFPGGEKGKGIVAIVGPNGSGKSNVSDAIRWALGEQSMKTLRGKKSEDIIFSGSSSLPRLGFAEVTLGFDNRDGQAPIDYFEFSITRRIYRSGESEYLIGKSKVRLSDIVMLLAKSNFGQGSYSIIGQGMVDSILASTLLERKAFFDEATGVKQYQIKREKSLKKLYNTIENLKQTEITLKEIEPRLRSLARQAKKLERREAVEKEFRTLQKSHYSGQWSDLGAKAKEHKSKIGELESVSGKIKKELEDISVKLDGLRREDSRQQVFTALQKDYDVAVGERNALLREKSILEGKVDIEHEKMGQANVVWMGGKKDDLEREVARIECELSSLQESMAGQKKILDENQKELESLQVLAEEAQKESEANKRSQSLTWPDFRVDLEEVLARSKEIGEGLAAGASGEKLESARSLAKSVTEKLSSMVQRIKDHLSGEKSPCDQAGERLRELTGKMEGLGAKISEARVFLGVKAEKESMLRERLDELKGESAKISAELKKAKAVPKDKNERMEVYERQKAELEGKISEISAKAEGIKAKISDFNRSEQEKKEALFASQRQIQEKQGELDSVSSKLSSLRIEMARIEANRENLAEEILDDLGIEDPSSSEWIVPKGERMEISEEEVEAKIRKYRAQLELIGGIDPEVMEEYARTSERFEFLSGQAADLKEAIQSLKKIIKELNGKISRQFNASFEKINKEFQKYFKVLFSGGNARLALQRIEKKEEEDWEGMEEGAIEDLRRTFKELSRLDDLSGIEIYATPPGKKLRGVGQLSGGERALTCIALICAIISNNPAPFVVLDEVDAALDEANSIKLAEIIEDLAQKTQFIIITHNRATMEKADLLYGVTMGEDGTSQLLGVNLEEAARACNR